MSSSSSSSASSSSPVPLLSRPWEDHGGHAFGGVPPFDRVKVEDFEGAMRHAMAAMREELKAITSLSDPADFQNTIEAFERAGEEYARISAIYDVWDSNLSSEAFQQVSKVLSPLRAEFRDEIVQNAELFSRISEVYGKREALTDLRPDQQRLLWRKFNTFVRSGALLTAGEKEQVAEINKRLASLFDSFGAKLKADEAKCLFLSKDSGDLAGLPESFVASLATKAASMGREGEYAVANTRSAMEPFLTYSTRRDLREQVFQAYIKRGDNGDENDTKALCKEMLQLRARRAKLYGYPTHAHWRLEIAMAKTPENAMELMEAVWGPAVERVKQEVADMQKIADESNEGIKIAPWDYRFYAEKVRKAKFDLEDSEITPYLQLDKIQEAMFWCAEKMYGFTFEQISGIPVFHEDMTTFRVSRNGEVVGLWYYDPYAREGKSSGAWMTDYREQSKYDRPVMTLVSNNCNFLKAAAGKPILISWDDAITSFHEFGHALHGLCSNVNYPSQAGTNVATDFVEFPSQLNEHWLSTPEVFNKFALHFESGEPMPAELQEKIKVSNKFNKGFDTVEYLSCALYDMKIHLLGDEDVDIGEFERTALAKLGMPKEIVMRHRPTQFFHIFGCDDYSAGYYSYLWSDALVADAREKFEKEGGPFAGPTAQSYFDHIVSVGDTLPQDEAWRNFMGRDVNRDALMRMRGFA